MLPWMPSWVGAIDRMKWGHTLEDRRGAVLAFALLVFFWGSVWGAIKIGLEYAPPVLFAGTRMLICGAVLTLVALIWGGRAPGAVGGRGAVPARGRLHHGTGSRA